MKKSRAKNPKPDIHFRVTVEEHNKLQQIAKQEDRSVAYLIARIVREWLDNKETGK